MKLGRQFVFVGFGMLAGHMAASGDWVAVIGFAFVLVGLLFVSLSISRLERRR